MKRPIPLHLLAGVLLFLLGVNSSFAAEPAAIPTKTVNSIAELRDVIPANHQVVVVLDYYGTRSGGYYPAHRRGAGIFRWVRDLTGGFAFMNVEDGGLHITNNVSTNGIWNVCSTAKFPTS
jgi:hypothetical protein